MIRRHRHRRKNGMAKAEKETIRSHPKLVFREQGKEKPEKTRTGSIRETEVCIICAICALIIDLTSALYYNNTVCVLD